VFVPGGVAGGVVVPESHEVEVAADVAEADAPWPAAAGGAICALYAAALQADFAAPLEAFSESSAWLNVPDQ
jgi:hypothetical protein